MDESVAIAISALIFLAFVVIGFLRPRNHQHRED